MSRCWWDLRFSCEKVLIVVCADPIIGRPFDLYLDILTPDQINEFNAVCFSRYKFSKIDAPFSGVLTSLFM